MNSLQASNVKRKSSKWAILLSIILTAIIVGLSVSFTLNLLENRKEDEEKRLIGAVAMSASQLEELISKKGFDAYWSGPRPGYLYLLDTSNKAGIFVSYVKERESDKTLESGNRVIATYKVKNAYQDSLAAAKRVGNIGFRNPDGSVVFYSSAKSTNVYLAFPKEKFQIEIFDSIPGQALNLAILQGQISKIGE